MARFLRMTRQARWLTYPDLEWMSPSEIQSDALGDLQTKDNKLSVYRIENEEEAERVVIALAANRDNLANLDYAVFEDTILESTDIAIRQQTGETPDEEVNRLHYDLIGLTVGRLAQLAEVLSKGQHDRVPRKQIAAGLRRSVVAGMLDRSRLSPQLLERIK